MVLRASCQGIAAFLVSRVDICSLKVLFLIEMAKIKWTPLQQKVRDAFEQGMDVDAIRETGIAGLDTIRRVESAMKKELRSGVRDIPAAPVINQVKP